MLMIFVSKCCIFAMSKVNKQLSKLASLFALPFAIRWIFYRPLAHDVKTVHLEDIWGTTSKFRHSTELIINENSIVYKHLSSTKGIRASGLYAHFVEYHRVDFGMQSSNNHLSSSALFAGRKTLFDGCIFQTKPLCRGKEYCERPVLVPSAAYINLEIIFSLHVEQYIPNLC